MASFSGLTCNLAEALCPVGGFPCALASLVVILDNLTEMLFDLVVWDQFVFWECRWFGIFNEGFDFPKF